MTLASQSTLASQITFECYLCALAHEPARHEGFPPGFDYASKLPVCLKHVREPTSVSTRQEFVRIQARSICANCKNVIRPAEADRTDAYELDGKTYILIGMLKASTSDEPSGLCNSCFVLLLTKAIMSLGVAPVATQAPQAILAVRVEDYPVPEAESAKAMCMECSSPIWVAITVIAEYPDLPAVCVECAGIVASEYRKSTQNSKLKTENS